MKKVHYLSGIIITTFVGLHLFNHTWSILGPEEHLAVMQALRPVYRHVIVETGLLLAVLVQVLSGLKLFRRKKNMVTSNFGQLQIWTGLYLAIFFVIHVGAVIGGRFFLHLDTNLYFGVAGLNTFPFALFFIPYYGLALLSFFGHLAAIHSAKMQQSIFGLTPKIQAKTILIIGLVWTIAIFYGLTNHFRGMPIPEEYGVLTGQ